LYLSPFLWLITACDIAQFNSNQYQLTEDDEFLAGQIIGESISEGQEGLLSTFQEAFAVPTLATLIVGPSLLSTQNFTDLEGYQHSYDVNSGIHTITFSRNFVDGIVAVSSEYILTYKFLDLQGNSIENPDGDRNLIEAVEYKAIRTGEVSDSVKVSRFQRIDHLFIDGISSNSDLLVIDGYHSGQGSYSTQKPDSFAVSREYLIDVNFLDISIDKPIVQTNQNFRTGVFGAFSYETTLRQSGNGDDLAKIVNGTIELNGDGTALLRFKDKPEPLRFQLNNGSVYERDEFEGRLISVNLGDSTLVLTGGQRLKLNSNTRISNSGDLTSLVEVATALNGGLIIIAEGKYFQPNTTQNLWIVEVIEFDLESNEFEDDVETVDMLTKSFKLKNGTEFFIVNRSQIRVDGRVVRSLELVAAALLAGIEVEAEGEFFVDRSTGRRNISKVEFEIKDEDEDDDGNNGNPGNGNGPGNGDEDDDGDDGDDN